MFNSKAASFLSALIAIIALNSCGQNKSSSTNFCPDPSDTSINGAQMNKASTLDPQGHWRSQVHLEATQTKPPQYSSLFWVVERNRQTCSSGSLSASGNEYYLQIQIASTLMDMQVKPGLNYIDYTAFGCKPVTSGTTAKEDCSEVFEKGTIVLNINYIP